MAARAEGTGIHRITRELGVGVGTVLRVTGEAAQIPANPRPRLRRSFGPRTSSITSQSRTTLRDQSSASGDRSQSSCVIAGTAIGAIVAQDHVAALHSMRATRTTAKCGTWIRS
jgi:hypothetical protein